MTEMSASPPGRRATRSYIRHPADIPIEVSAAGTSVRPVRHTFNVSVGGLAFESNFAFLPDAIVAIRIPGVRPVFETRARVVWCSVGAQGYELGVEFLDPEDAFRARMVEQVCHGVARGGPANRGPPVNGRRGGDGVDRETRGGVSRPRRGGRSLSCGVLFGRGSRAQADQSAAREEQQQARHRNGDEGRYEKQLGGIGEHGPVLLGRFPP